MGDDACSCRNPVGLRAGTTSFVERALGRVAARVAVRDAVLAMATGPFESSFPVPEYPPADWFDGPPTWVAAYRAEQGLGPDVETGPGGEPIYKLTVTDDGRIGGWFFEHGQCLVHMPDACPGPSPTGYAAFHQGDVVTADGKMLRVGVIGNTNGHASPWVNWQDAQRKYADPSAQLIVCRAGDDDRGGWIAGAMISGVTYADVALCRRSALSGDWRPDFSAQWFAKNGATAAAVAASDGYDCVGPTLVTRPGLPLTSGGSARGYVLAASVGGTIPQAKRTERAVLHERRPVRVAGLTIEETAMTTTVELPDGTKVHMDGPASPQADAPEPVIDAAVEPETETETVDEAVVADPEAVAVTAAPEDVPIDETAPPEGDGADTAVGSVEERLTAIEGRLDAIEEFLSQMIESEMAAALAADVELPAVPDPVEDEVSTT